MDFSALYDRLYCQEVHFEEEEEEVDQSLALPDAGESGLEEDEEWAEALSSLLANEVETHPDLSAAAGGVYLDAARRPAVEWVVKTCGQHGFSVQTVLLAVNYLDRCFLAAGGRGLRLQEDKPWMGRLAAVACLSLAAKVEETRVPLLLDLQLPIPAAAEEMGYLFENRTIVRMELLVLSTLGWRMNPVTPLSLARRLLTKFPVAAGHCQELLCRCESALLSVLADWRWIRYPPSVWAAAVLHSEMRPGDFADVSPEMHPPLDLLNISKEKVGGAYHLILELAASGNGVVGTKRKHIYYSECGSFYCYSPSESQVCSCFTSDSSSKSVDSSATVLSASSSFPDPPPFKKPNVKQIRENGENKDLVGVEHGVLLA